MIKKNQKKPKGTEQSFYSKTEQVKKKYGIKEEVGNWRKRGRGMKTKRWGRGDKEINKRSNRKMDCRESE